MSSWDIHARLADGKVVGKRHEEDLSLDDSSRGLFKKKIRVVCSV